MKSVLASAVLMVLLFPVLASGETMDDLLKQKGLYYKKISILGSKISSKSSDVPFTGKITGKTQGSIRNGKKGSPWVDNYENGQLYYKGTYKDGKIFELSFE